MQFKEFAALLTARFHELADDPGVVLEVADTENKRRYYKVNI